MNGILKYLDSLLIVLDSFHPWCISSFVNTPDKNLVSQDMETLLDEVRVLKEIPLKDQAKLVFMEGDIIRANEDGNN